MEEPQSGTQRASPEESSHSSKRAALHVWLGGGADRPLPEVVLEHFDRLGQGLDRTP